MGKGHVFLRDARLDQTLAIDIAPELAEAMDLVCTGEDVDVPDLV